MSDRAMIPLAVAGMLGFICGLLASVLQLTGGAAVTVGVIAGAASALAALASVVGVRAERSEITIVALLRAGLAAVLAVFIFAGMLAFLRDGKVLVAFLLWAIAGFVALVLPQILVRTRGEGSEGGQTA